MRVLVLGFSRIVSNRVLPALERVDGVSEVEIASRRGRPDPARVTPKVVRLYTDFAEALDAGRADLVYVSTVNSEHAQWVRRALASHCHVVVDKPSFLDLGEAEALVALAAREDRILAEATVYTAHPQIQEIKAIFTEHDTRPTRIAAVFSMPPLEADNFRYRKRSGGGALWDLGPYAVSLGRLFFDSDAQSVSARVTSRGGPDIVDTAFSALMTYPRGGSLIGHFGFDTDYRNQATLVGPGASVHLSRIFTTPPALENKIEVRVEGRDGQRRIVAADSFACFFEDLLESLPGGADRDRFGVNLIRDARALAALRRAAGED